ncbi:bifunctional metallophosphatase/5'-nucleotidase [Methylobacterium isbiliense]|uniref:Trifunctional nucleotide phosphoesterase protein YfkN n=1 Tax=Methylobacterium isbiliense TaxID=315478 RepID=A0ABQ4SD30_9HYPH|nr:bifunctional UDP-sugar hydrolase/5'-nucleotidase [Methylobacterium isbiliense]MDN3623816.1 bifunctional UDP-sugar hydrolase/5'-nucleotidase [Methylobacterium isbiliense]GJE01121.1 Trifunctional nucleotide phosphoesterase protein YfkN [Methylobacterium isbiliense]
MSRPSRRQTLGLGLGAGLSATLAGGPAQALGPDTDFTLLLVNDIYRMGALDGRGGFAKLAAIVKAERARGVPLLFCHAGDTLSPSLMSGFDKGRHIIELTNLIRPDVFVPGNHEFDFGQEIFLQRLGEATFPFFAANLRRADGTPIPGMQDSTILSLGPVKVGVVGLALPETPQKARSGDWRFGPALDTLRAEAARLRAAGAEFLVAVTHTDRPTDDVLVRSRLVDVVLSGHDHDLALRYDGRTIFVESSEEGYYVTAIDVRLDFVGEGKARRIVWTPSFRIHDSSAVEPDPEVLAIVSRLEAQLSRELDVPVGRTDVDLDTRISAIRQGETAFGDLVADAMRAAGEAEIAITNGGGFRGNRLYPAGSMLTRRDVSAELPFGNTLVVVEITGAQVLAALENGFAELGRPAGRFPQVSGLAVTVEAAAPVGRRVAAARADGTPLDPERRYRVAANNFMLGGGNGYGMLADGRTLLGATDGPLLANLVMSYIAAHAPVRVETGRILIR